MSSNHIVYLGVGEGQLLMLIHGSGTYLASPHCARADCGLLLNSFI